MKIDVQFISAEGIKVGEDAVVNIFIDGKQIPASYFILRSETLLTVSLMNPMFDLELRRKYARQPGNLRSGPRKGSGTKKEK